MQIKRSTKKGKKFMVKVGKKIIHFGAQGYKIAPGTKKGDRYCTRSFGIKDKSGKPTRNKITSPNYWSRLKWRCIGKKSKR